MTAPTLRPGDLLNSWCYTCHEATPHRFEPGTKVPLKCVQCEERAK